MLSTNAATELLGLPVAKSLVFKDGNVVGSAAFKACARPWPYLIFNSGGDGADASASKSNEPDTGGVSEMVRIALNGDEKRHADLKSLGKKTH